MKKTIGTITAALILLIIARGVPVNAPYVAIAVIQFKPDAGNPEKLLAAHLPKDDPSVTLKPVPNSQLFQILVSASDPRVAEKRADQIALTLQSQLNGPDGSAKTLLILQKASAPAPAPSSSPSPPQSDSKSSATSAPVATSVPATGDQRRGMAQRVLEELRLLDSATDQYAIETNKQTGFRPTFTDLKNYLKAGTRLYDTGADPLGTPYGPFTVDSIPKVSDSTFNALSDVANEDFWSPYK
jgi:hypothetical protein